MGAIGRDGKWLKDKLVSHGVDISRLILDNVSQNFPFSRISGLAEG